VTQVRRCRTSPRPPALPHFRVQRIADEAGARAVAVAWHDYETRKAWHLNGDELFHAASTIKVPSARRTSARS
jgi:hypothetical protein